MIDTAGRPDASLASSCAACKTQRKKCTDKCLLAPYFRQDDAEKFLLVHRVFGNGHVIKLLQDLPSEQRGEAVSSMVYEASERLRDPVHGCVGVINDLHKKVVELESQLASAEVALANMTQEYANLFALVTGCHEGSGPNFYTASPPESEDTATSPIQAVVDDVDPLQLWDPLWS